MHTQLEQSSDLQRLEHLVRMYRLGLAVTGLVIVALLLILFAGRTPRFGRAILIDDQVVAMVRSEKAAAAVRDRLLQAGRGEFTSAATFTQQWEEATRPLEGAELLSVGETVRRLAPKVTVVVEAVSIEAAGRPLVVVATKDEADSILTKLKSRYTSQSDAVVKSTRLEPEPTIRPVTVPPREVERDILRAAEVLSGSRATTRTYAVQAGDFPERIAVSNHMPLHQLYELNPGLQGSTLRVGQKLTVLGARTGLVTITVKETAALQTTAPPVVRTPSASLPRGVTKVIDPGQPGRQRVRVAVTMRNEQEIDRHVLSQETVAQPRPKRVLVGTGQPPPKE